MWPSLNFVAYQISVWFLPVILAVTFHRAAHGFVALLLGDDTAWRMGRVSFNPLRHVDPFGTIVLPALLLLFRAPFLFGCATPVPVTFRALRHPRSGMILMAAAGPGINLALAVVAALGFHLLAYLLPDVGPWGVENLKNALILNVVLVAFNMVLIPPLDGGRIVTSLQLRGHWPIPTRVSSPTASRC
jgi:Zn-dependent protease